MTNFEAIRRMDVWDLAEKLVEWTGCECENCPAVDDCDLSGEDVMAENCEIMLKTWLEAENKPYKPKKLSETRKTTSGGVSNDEP